MYYKFQFVDIVMMYINNFLEHIFQRHDDTYRDFFWESEYPSAIYTHRYDSSGTRLFAAGGPLPAGLWGNYAGLWQ
jgi:hypothetical protein